MIEITMGREETIKWGPRLIDIDILLFADKVVNKQHLVIPHPYLQERNFVLLPLMELNFELSIPKLGKIREFTTEQSLNAGIKKIN